LCRKNTQCTEIAEGLEALGIRASASQGALMETRECQLALAALRYMHDTKDTVALATIVHLSQLHSDNRSWLQSLVQDKERGLSQWKSDPLIEKLDLARSAQRHRTPMEALEYAISSADLVSTVRAWPEAASRLANLDLLRGVCAAYLDQCRARRGAATVAGFINYIQDLQQGEAEGTGRQTVQVLTYHKSKGLEWPIVILSALDSKSRSGAFGIEVEPAAVFDPANPLADRSVRFWPWPFGSLKNVEELQERLQTRQEEITTIERAAKESHRLIYVGMTRAREGLIFAQRKKILKNEISLKTAWLDELTDLNGRPLLELPVQSGSHTLDIAGTKIPVKVYEYMEAVQNNSNKIPAEEHYLPQMPTVITVYPPARISPSGLTLEQSGLKEITVQEITRLGDPVIIKGSPDPASLGNALHGFFGIETDALSGPELSETARAIINCWEITEALSAQDMLTVGERLHTFINKNYPGARVLREWPVTLHNTAHQRMHGWIDMLLELPEGYIVIDHKSYSGNDPKEHARQFAPQLAVYKEAIEKATGKEVISTLLHLPILGRIFKMTFSLNM
ncbi:PD-(D/E)XK nuclease family protein, partial [bacterium]|nr:PD-(D/E)XK nuclease family protein [bacterium]